ncbi:ribosome recycling factor [Atractiella rhizophila]|nr:ribosome recycling factor [Atractiella rhizophila]
MVRRPLFAMGRTLHSALRTAYPYRIALYTTSSLPAQAIQQRPFSHSRVVAKKKKTKDMEAPKDAPDQSDLVEPKFNVKKVEGGMRSQVEKLQVALVPVVGRAGRVTDRLLDAVTVLQGSQKFPLREYAAVSVQDARTLKIDVYSTDAVGLVMNALQTSHLKLSPNAGPTPNSLLVKIAPPDNKVREDLARKAAEVCEHARVAIRNLKNQAQKDIKSDEQQNRSTKDDVFRDGKKLDEITKKVTAEVDKIAAAAKKVCLDE